MKTKVRVIHFSKGSIVITLEENDDETFLSMTHKKATMILHGSRKLLTDKVKVVLNTLKEAPGHEGAIRRWLTLDPESTSYVTVKLYEGDTFIGIADCTRTLYLQPDLEEYDDLVTDLSVAISDILES